MCINLYYPTSYSLFLNKLLITVIHKSITIYSIESQTKLNSYISKKDLFRKNQRTIQVL